MEETSNAANKKKNSKVIVTVNELDNLKEISQQLPAEARIVFERKYGCILDLLHISVEASALSALTQFWNPSLRCFEFPNLDLTPTIEEYARMLGLPVRENTHVYLTFGCHLSDECVAELFGVEVNQLRFELRGATRGLMRTYVEAHLRTLAKEKNWDVFSRVLALAIYGLVLFPSAFDLVDFAAMDVLFRFETQRENPIPAILAETFLSLGFCHQRRKKAVKLRCCAHLLHVWIITHMYADSYLNYLPGSSPLHPVRSFNRIDLKKLGMYEWLEELSKVETRTIKWVCPWYHDDKVVYSCGDFANVPLMGPRGCIAYTPALVLNQLCWVQTVPQVEQIGGLCFFYQDDEFDERQVR